MRVSWFALENRTYYFIEKESLDNPGMTVRWGNKGKMWMPPNGKYTTWVYEKDAYDVLMTLIGR